MTASADRLAYQVARLVHLRVIGERSGASDALLDYLNVGGIGGPSNVPDWMKEYERVNEIPLAERVSNGRREWKGITDDNDSD